jgi:hypothetical protein
VLSRNAPWPSRRRGRAWNTRIEKYPWSSRNLVNYQVTIYAMRFETESAGQARLVARWIIKDGASGKDL